MRAPSRLAQALAVVVTAALGPGCEDRRAPPPASTAHVEQDVRALLGRWLHAFESRDADAVRSVLADDGRFVWLEDGEARYQSVDAVVTALASFPTALTFSHKLDAVRIVPISGDAAWAQLAATTQIRQGERVVSDFGGVVLMLVQRDQAGWRIVAAHTSTTSPRSPSRG
jgi:uncharacterized protein (TIGR02246 family)